MSYGVMLAGWMQDVAETQEKAGLKEECIEFYDKVKLFQMSSLSSEAYCCCPAEMA